MSMAMPIRVLINDSASAPAASPALAISAMSVTFGDSFRITGFFVCFFACVTTSAAAFGSVPKMMPPSLTFGQETFNSMAATKELVDVCVTSSNALKIVKNLPQKNIYFIPDKNLGSWIAEQVPEKNFILGDGYCHVHDCITPEDIEEYRAKYPGCKVLVHPECPLTVSKMADYVGSTSGIIDYATESPDKEFIVGTEAGVLHELKRKNPDKEFHFIEKAACEDMHRMTLEDVAACLRENSPKAELDEGVRQRAEASLDRMLELAK